MKAKIYYRRPDSTLPHNKWKYTVKTIEVSKNEPNHILQEFIKITRLPQYTYVTHIKCGRYDYQWYNSSNLDTALIVRKHYSVRNMTALILS